MWIAEGEEDLRNTLNPFLTLLSNMLHEKVSGCRAGHLASVYVSMPRVLVPPLAHSSCRPSHITFSTESFSVAAGQYLYYAGDSYAVASFPRSSPMMAETILASLHPQGLVLRY